MLRIHFTLEDLARTRIAAAADPLWEISLSLQALRQREVSPLLAPWKRRLIQLLHPKTDLRNRISLALTLNPPIGYFPDFLTPIETGNGFEAGLEAVCRTPKQRLRHEIGTMAGLHRSAASVISDIGHASAEALTDLATGMRLYHEVAIAPMWSRITAAVDADRAQRSRTLAGDGLAELLNQLHPTTRFANGVLEISHYVRSGDLHLAGQGLLLIPSYFKAAGRVLLLADPGLPPVLVYPIDPNIRVVTETNRRPLAALIGPTRADVLEVAGSGGTTSEIALRLGISRPAASKHLTVLREAGLVVSLRDQNSVRHLLSPLGSTLLAGR